MQTGAAAEDDASGIVDDNLDRIALADRADDAPVAIGDLTYDLLLGLAGVWILEGAKLLGLLGYAAGDAHFVSGDQRGGQLLPPIRRKVGAFVRRQLEQLAVAIAPRLDVEHRA